MMENKDLAEMVKSPFWKTLKRFVGQKLTIIEEDIYSLRLDPVKCNGTTTLIMQRRILKELLNLPNELETEITTETMKKQHEKNMDEFIDSLS